MTPASHIADVVRTLIVAAVVGFLGYQGIELIRERINNPPPQIVRLEGEELKELRHSLDGAVEHMLSRLSVLEDRARRHLPFGLPEETRVECGRFEITFTEQQPKTAGGEGGGPKWFYDHEVTFGHRYVTPPLVIVTDNSVTGAWPHVAVHKITTSGAVFKLNLHHGAMGRTATIAYLVIGEAN
ncbi:MAG: hypothetical protein C4547_05925 [Phycisphaerales bacterium]|nr:MAG: hypothetical protein C4547_05925 [Phycisphaerales bacterium]